MRIGMFGTAGSGKDTLFEAMQRINPDIVRVAFGDVVKRSAAPLLQLHGVDVSTMTREQKNLHRPLLERLGDLSWELAGTAWLKDLPLDCVNTRIQRDVEARQWLDAGGMLVEVQRNEPATDLERRYVEQMRHLPHVTIYNSGTLEDLESSAAFILRHARSVDTAMGFTDVMRRLGVAIAECGVPTSP